MGKRDETKNSQNQPGTLDKWLPAIVVAIITVVGYIIVALINRSTAIEAALKPIEATQTAEALHTLVAMTQQYSLEIITSTPSYLPTDTPTVTFTFSPSATPEYSSAIKTMDNFFSLINNAQSKADLIYSWSLETSEFQCAEAAKCNLSKFQDFWMQFKVNYKLYDCGYNIVDTEQTYYPRDPLSTSGPRPSFSARYVLKEIGGQLKINNTEITLAPNPLCELRVAVP